MTRRVTRPGKVVMRPALDGRDAHRAAEAFRRRGGEP